MKRLYRVRWTEEYQQDREAESPEQAIEERDDHNSFDGCLEVNASELFTCGNCGHEAEESELRPLAEVKHLAERLTPGDEVPAGECKKCGALSYAGVPAPKAEPAK